MIVSVAMITYKHEKFLKQAIEGVLMQETNFEFDLIIADDCSPDATSHIVHDVIANHPHGNKIKYFRHKKNIGMQPNGLFVLQQCKSKYIAICEGDDYWTNPLKLQKQVDFLEANTDYVLCFHPVNILKTDGTIVDDFITKVPENHETIETLARLGNYIHTPSVVFRNVLKELPVQFEQSPIGDYFLYMLLAQQGKLKFLKEKMCVYREGVGIWSSKSDFHKNFNTAYLHALLVGSGYFSDLISRILLSRIALFLEAYVKIMVTENFTLLNSCPEVNKLIYSSLYNERAIIIQETIQMKTSIELLTEVFFRIKKRLW